MDIHTLLNDFKSHYAAVTSDDKWDFPNDAERRAPCNASMQNCSSAWDAFEAVVTDYADDCDDHKLWRWLMREADGLRERMEDDAHNGLYPTCNNYACAHWLAEVDLSGDRSRWALESGGISFHGWEQLAGLVFDIMLREMTDSFITWLGNGEDK